MKALAFIFLLLAAIPAQAVTLERDTRWSGEVRLAERVIVPAGVVLEIVPGTQVRFTSGGLEVSGRLQASRARLDGRNWDGLILKGCDAQTVLTDVVVSGARTGILVQGGAPVLDRMIFEGNETGLELRGKSAAVVQGSQFRGNRKVGLFVKDDSVASVRQCRFEAQGKYGAYIYRANPARFEGNRFERNPVGLMVAYFGSNPLIADNEFVDNQTAVEVDRAARPQLRGNRLKGNRLALLLQRRADPVVSGNRFSDNDVAVKLMFSSYPQISGNDFAGNRLALQLEFQSSTWEREQGAQARAGEVASIGVFGSGQGAKTVTEDDRRPAALDGTVDARNNWWGDAGSLELARNGEQGNPSFIHDGRDQATFVEQGKNYPLDKVVFAPWGVRPYTRENP